MKCSVIIPYYNKEKCLFQLLRSLNKQICNEFEAIVVNDGSDDIRGSIDSEAYAYPLKYLYCERIPKSGIAYARNNGIKAARGDILIFLHYTYIFEFRNRLIDLWKEINNYEKARQKNFIVITRTVNAVYPAANYHNFRG